MRQTGKQLLNDRRARPTGRRPPAMTSRNVRPVTKSITRKSAPSMPKSVTETQCGWARRLIARASVSNRLRNAFCAAIQGCRNLIATGRSSCTRSPRVDHAHGAGSNLGQDAIAILQHLADARIGWRGNVPDHPVRVTRPQIRWARAHKSFLTIKGAGGISYHRLPPAMTPRLSKKSRTA